MTKPFKIDRRFVEEEVRSIYRLQGKLVPTSIEEVAAAESRLDAEEFELPARLNELPSLQREHPKPTYGVGHPGYWTHSSVKALETDDPVEGITRKARHVVLSAIERGWNGPPYDPSQLAELLDIHLLPTEAVVDARTRSVGGKFRIEFNPMRPAARLRFSVAHEIGHTLFPDCAYAIRNRATHEQMRGDEWQLEMLCNIAAAEILMPIGSLPDVNEFVPTVDSILHFRRRFQVSSEAVMLRLIRLTPSNCFAFAAHRDAATNRYRVDYVIGSRGFSEQLPFETGFTFPKDARARECTAIGFTAKGKEPWLMRGSDWQTEYLGVAPYPGQAFPRVLGLVRTDAQGRHSSTLRFLKGDASEPRGSGAKVLLQIVNDKALTWGAGFARALKNRWPSAQREFTEWALSRRREFRLGGVHLVAIRDDLSLASLVAQHGYGPSDKPRLRYGALEQCLTTVAGIARQRSASVHMPRIGSGQAGGSWAIVEEIVQQTLARQNLDITVYDLPNQKAPIKQQPSLFDVPADVDQFV